MSVKEKDETIVNQHKHIDLLKEQNIDDKKAANLVSLVQCLLHQRLLISLHTSSSTSYYQVLYSELQALDVCKSETRDRVLAERQHMVKKVEIMKNHHSQILSRSQDASNLLLKTKDTETMKLLMAKDNDCNRLLFTKDKEMKRLMMEKQKECHQMLLAKNAEMKKLMRLLKEQKIQCDQILLAKDAETKKLMNDNNIKEREYFC